MYMITYTMLPQGNYSEHDKTNWTPELRRALNFDQMQALQIDNGLCILLIQGSKVTVFFVINAGVFWIDWSSLHSFYDVIYMNWRPGLFKNKSTIHEYVMAL